MQGCFSQNQQLQVRIQTFNTVTEKDKEKTPLAIIISITLMLAAVQHIIIAVIIVLDFQSSRDETFN